jgi:hypothetical protein
MQPAAVRVDDPDRATVVGGGAGDEQDLVPARLPAPREEAELEDQAWRR